MIRIPTLVIGYFLVIITLVRFTSNVNAAVIKRKVSDGRTTRYLLYYSRHMEGSCLKTCTPTTPPTTRPPTRPPTTCPTCPTCPTRAPTPQTCPTCPPCQVATKNGCGCTSDCCSTCPAGTKCIPNYLQDSAGNTVLDSDGNPLKCGCKCIACDCGFCNSQQKSCCNADRACNNCIPKQRDNNSLPWQTDAADECDAATGRWPQLAGHTGNVCSNVEIKMDSVPKGCGCEPTQTTPCNFDPNAVVPASGGDAQGKDKCFICSVEDLAQQDPGCLTCIPCLLQSWVPPRNCTNSGSSGQDDPLPGRRILLGDAVGSSGSSISISSFSGLGRALSGSGGSSNGFVPCNQTQAEALQCVTDAIAANDAAALRLCFEQKYSPNEYVFDKVMREQQCATQCSKIKINGFQPPTNSLCPVPPTPTPPAPTPSVPTAPTPRIFPTPPVGPPHGGGSGGDPHFKTWLGHYFDYQGECDLVLVDAPSFGGGAGLFLHIRTTIHQEGSNNKNGQEEEEEDSHFESAHFSFIERAALRIGNETLEVANGGKYFLNGQPQVVPAAALDPASAAAAAGTPFFVISGFEVVYRVVKKTRRLLEINLSPNQGTITIREYRGFLTVSIEDATADNFGDSKGLMGSFETGAMLARDGTTVMRHDPIGFGQEWQVHTDELQLFQERRDPQYPQSCIMPPASSISMFQRQLDHRRLLRGVDNNNKQISSKEIESLRQAERACAKWTGVVRDACIMDVLTTGDIGMADEAGAF